MRSSTWEFHTDLEMSIVAEYHTHLLILALSIVTMIHGTCYDLSVPYFLVSIGIWCIFAPVALRGLSLSNDKSLNTMYTSSHTSTINQTWKVLAICQWSASSLFSYAPPPYPFLSSEKLQVYCPSNSTCSRSSTCQHLADSCSTRLMTFVALFN